MSYQTQFSFNRNSPAVSVFKNDFIVNGSRARLAGSHTWNTVQSFNGVAENLDNITGNFTRLWAIEPGRVNTSSSQWRVGGGRTFNISPSIYAKTEDGKYDLSKINPVYLRRLKSVVRGAQDRSIVVQVVLFDGAWNRYFGKTSWNSHPFNPKNNIQNVGPSSANGIHSRGNWNIYQRNYVKTIINRLSQYKNVIYEIGNELHRSSIPWQNRMVDYINGITDVPVGVSYVTRTPNDWMGSTNADYIVPNAPRGTSATRNYGFRGPRIFDSDHGWALGSNVAGLKSHWSAGSDLLVMYGGGKSGILRNLDNLSPDLSYIDSLA